MIRALKGTDRVLLGTSAFLLLLGLVTLASASVALSFKQFGHAYYYILRQVILGVGVGSLLFFLGLKISPHIYRKYALPLLLLSIITVSLVFVSGIGFGTGVARRWIHLGPLSFQPSEMLKLAFIIYLAAWMTSKKEYLTSLTHGLIPFLILVGLMGALLIAEPDLGTLGVLATSSLGVFFIGGGKTKQVLVSAAAGLLILSIVVTAVPYARDRFFVFLNPSAESQGRGYQISQARIAIGSGGLFGRGIGLSRQKYYYLPEPAGDAVFAIYAEEFGFIGVIVLLSAFFLFFFRGMMVAVKTRDRFMKLLAVGITLLVVVQVAVNIGALSGLIPLTGLPLPFLSYGGSALAFLLFEIGILLRISKHMNA